MTEFNLVKDASDFEKLKFDVTGKTKRSSICAWLAEVSTSPSKLMPDFSGSSGRYCKYNIYQTKAGSLLIYKEIISQWEGERNKYILNVFETLQQLKCWANAIEHGLAEYLLFDKLEELGIDCSVFIA